MTSLLAPIAITLGIAGLVWKFGRTTTSAERSTADPTMIRQTGEIPLREEYVALPLNRLQAVPGLPPEAFSPSGWIGPEGLGSVDARIVDVTPELTTVDILHYHHGGIALGPGTTLRVPLRIVIPTALLETIRGESVARLAGASSRTLLNFGGG